MPVGPASQDVTKGDSADNLRTVSPCPGYGLLAVKSTVTRLVVLQTLNLSDDGFAAGSACLLVSGEVLRQRCVGLTGFTHAAN
jgi:hypothetical protein